MKEKKILIMISLIGIVCASLFLFASVACSYDMDFLPKEIEAMGFRCETLKISEDGTYSFTDSGLAHIIHKNNENETYIKNALRILKNVEIRKCEIMPTDVQLVEFSFLASANDEYDQLETYIFAYDFYHKMLYAVVDGEWCSILESNDLNLLIVGILDICLEHQNRWLGQSTFASEEFCNSDFDDQTFRYNLYWSSMHFSTKTNSYRVDGFVNVTPVVIKSKEDVKILAAKEMGYKNPISSVFYDETCGFWLVEIFENDELLDFSNLTNDNCSALFEKTYTVIMDDEGFTLEVYPGITSFAAFQNAWGASEKTGDGSLS